MKRCLNVRPKSIRPRSYRPTVRRNRSTAFVQRPVIVVQPPPPPPRDWVQIIVTSLPGIAAVIALVFAYMTIQSTNQGQITDRFNAAVTNLGSTDEEVRMGGIYALQSIMQDSPSDQPGIIQILSAFIRDRAPARESTTTLGPPSAPSVNGGTPVLGPAAPSDIQAALDVLGNRDTSHDDGVTINLSDTDLQGANFTGDDFQGANFTQANLAGTRLFSVDFNGANLQFVNLSDALLTNADLSNAFLSDADFSHAYFVSADLGSAVLDDADFESAFLSGANFTGASMRDVDLKDAIVSGAKGLSDPAGR